MSKAVDRYAKLPHSQQTLIHKMQEINFGTIENLSVVSGEPHFSDDTRVIRCIKFGGTNGPRDERNLPDFALPDRLIEFFMTLQEIGDGTVERIDVRHGLPLQMHLKH